MFTVAFVNTEWLLVLMWLETFVESTHWQLLKKKKKGEKKRGREGGSSWLCCLLPQSQIGSFSSHSKVPTSCYIRSDSNRWLVRVCVHTSTYVGQVHHGYRLPWELGIKHDCNLSEKSTCGQAPALTPLIPSQLFNPFRIIAHRCCGNIHHWKLTCSKQDKTDPTRLSWWWEGRWSITLDQ